MAEDWQLALSEFKTDTTIIIDKMGMAVNKIETKVDGMTFIAQEQTNLMKEISKKVGLINGSVIEYKEKFKTHKEKIAENKEEIEKIEEKEIPILRKGFYGLAGVILVLLTGLCCTDNPLFSKLFRVIFNLF